MSIQTGARRQSWRTAGARPAAGTGSVRRRQIQTTVVLVVLVVAALLLAYFISTRRFQHTRVGSLLTAYPTNTSEPEQPYTWLPLRYGSESLAPLLAEKTQHFQVSSLTPSFDNSKNLVRALQTELKLLQSNDAFILWIRAKGIELDGKAYLLSGNYRLPASGEELTSPRGAVPFESIVETVSQWSGPVLILLDWGNQLCDPRAGVWENQFLSLVVDEIQAAPKQVACLVSHQPGELSLDSLASHQSLFGRACAEGIAGPRRHPADFKAEVWDRNHLLLGDLTEYVIRRVWADSAERQRPWLIQGQTGWISPETQKWQTATRVPLAQLGDQQRLLGWSALPIVDPSATSNAQDGKAQPAATSSAASTEAQDEVASSGTTSLSDSAWPTGKLWKVLDQWRTPSDTLAGWSLATLAPLTAKRMATMVLDLEHRWLAGSDFQGNVEGIGLRSRIEALEKNLQQEATRIEQAATTGVLSGLLGGPPSEIAPAEYSNWRQRVETLAAFRQLALILDESVALSDNLSKCVAISNDLELPAKDGILAAQSFLQSLSSGSTSSIAPMPVTDATRLTRDLKGKLSAIETSLSGLVTRALSDPLKERPLAELLTRHYWLSHLQRSELIASMNSTQALETKAAWPTKSLRSLRINAPQRGQPLAPQRVKLIEAAAEGQTELQSTPAQVVNRLNQVAASITSSGRIAEADWLTVDGRDLCQQEGGWEPSIQLPPFPAPPQPRAAWRLTWENVSGGQLSNEQLQLHSTTEPASVDVVLTRIGSATDIEAIQIQLTGLEGRIAGEAGRFQSGLLKLNQANLLRVVDLKANAQRLPLELRPIAGNDPQIPLGVQIRIEAGVSSPPPAQLACRLPIAVPVVLSVQQLVLRDGVTAWEDSPRRDALTTIEPFPGRKTQYRMLVTNQDNQPRVAWVELYRLPSRSSTHAKGRIGEIGGAVPSELEAQSLRSFSLISKSADIALPPNARDIQVDFSAASAAGAAAASAPAGGATPAAEVGNQANDIAWGLLAVVRLKSEPTRDDWRTWIELQPVEADDFLEARSKMTEDARTIELQVGLKDSNNDNVPDWMPADFSDEQPIVIDCQIGGGIDLRRVTFPMPRQILTKEKNRQTFTISSAVPIEEDVELQISVDGATRGLFEFVGVGGRAARRVPPDRLKLRSIGIKDGLTYLSDFQANLGENERQLSKFGAMFKRPVAAPLEIVLAVDAESRGRIGAPPEPVEFSLVKSSWTHPIGKFFGDRDLSASLAAQLGQTLTVQCQLSDWKFSFDPRQMLDEQFTFEGTIGLVANRELGKLVLDGSGPVVNRPPRLAEITEGQNVSLSFVAEDAVPLGPGTITVGPAGNPNLATPVGEKLTTDDFLLSNQGWQLRPQTLTVNDLPPGKYELRVQLADILGNESQLGPWRLSIKPKPTPAGVNGGAPQAPLKADIQGKLHFGNLNRKAPNVVTVKVKDFPEKTVTSSDGLFKISGLDSGEYTLEATTEFQGAIYKGEAQIKLLKAADYQRPIDITLSK
jgi:hypothetical protein